MHKKELKKLIDDEIKAQRDYMFNNVDYIDGYDHLPKESGFTDVTVSTDLDLDPEKYGFSHVGDLYSWIYEEGKITKKVLPYNPNGYYFGALVFLYADVQDQELYSDDLAGTLIDEETREYLIHNTDASTVDDNGWVIYSDPIAIIIYIDGEDLRPLLYQRYLEHNLPSGSGINSRWTFEIDKHGTMRARNTIDYLNERGFYDGFNDFTVRIPLSDDGYNRDNMRIIVHGWDHKTVKYWKDIDYQSYVEETIFDSLPSIF